MSASPRRRPTPRTRRPSAREQAQACRGGVIGAVTRVLQTNIGPDRVVALYSLDVLVRDRPATATSSSFT